MPIYILPHTVVALRGYVLPERNEELCVTWSDNP
jgi:hypothetical protein